MLAFEAVRTRRTVENVIDQIVGKIRTGELREGHLLPGERKLAAQMEVSRRTIRLAVDALSSAGVLEVTPGAAGGIRVATIWIPSDLTQETLGLSVDEVSETLEARRTLEPRVAQLAAIRATDEDIAAIQTAIDLHREVMNDRTKTTQVNSLFHRAMWRAAHNSLLEAAMEAIYSKLEIALDMTSRTSSDSEESLRIHESTLAALVKADLSEVEEVMDAHLGYLEAICADVFGRPLNRRLPGFLSGTPVGRGSNER